MDHSNHSQHSHQEHGTTLEKKTHTPRKEAMHHAGHDKRARQHIGDFIKDFGYAL